MFRLASFEQGGTLFVPSIHGEIAAGSITLNTMDLGDSWMVSVEVPPKTHPEDRRKLLDWIHEYRSSIRKTNPTWIVKDSLTENGYALRIFPVETGKQLRNALNGVMESWTASPSHYVRQR